eukprot:TRINITY_DN140_c0_g1_i2.p1 TRINITY_DN140_c0_g1~~TRINITY_DN140_c0_g1_i2.p1  ORF type:complete len:453 (+),score=92.52 TRINITY_DN140_c0_g1_i2:180-1361(+)
MDGKKKTDARSVTVKLYEKEHWPKSDTLISECSVPIDDMKTKDAWFQLEDTKKKEKNGEIHLAITFPAAPAAASTAASATAAAATGPTPLPSHADRTDAQFEAQYIRGKELGKGAFSIVLQGKRVSDGKPVAIKCVKKVGQSPDVIKLLKREISVMQKLHHPGIISLLDVHETPEMITMILELVTGGELYDQIISRGSFTEKDARSIIKQLLEALQYMHSNGCAHRDLKPENLLCEENGKIVKIADFGLSKDFSMASVMSTCCGSPSYVAPEVLSGGVYDTACDIWSIGVITYVLVSGYLPFFADTQPELFEKIMEGKFTFAQPLWKDVSNEVKEFITRCLTLDAASRPSASDLLKHPWVSKKEALRTVPLSTIASMADLRSGFNPQTRGKQQ